MKNRSKRMTCDRCRIDYGIVTEPQQGDHEEVSEEIFLNDAEFCQSCGGGNHRERVKPNDKMAQVWRDSWTPLSSSVRRSGLVPFPDQFGECEVEVGATLGLCEDQGLALAGYLRRRITFKHNSKMYVCLPGHDKAERED